MTPLRPLFSSTRTARCSTTCPATSIRITDAPRARRARGVALLARIGVPLFVISNQSGVALGKFERHRARRRRSAPASVRCAAGAAFDATSIGARIIREASCPSNAIMRMPQARAGHVAARGARASASISRAAGSSATSSTTSRPAIVPAAAACCIDNGNETEWLHGEGRDAGPRRAATCTKPRIVRSSPRECRRMKRDAMNASPLPPAVEAHARMCAATAARALGRGREAHAVRASRQSRRRADDHARAARVAQALPGRHITLLASRCGAALRAFHRR